MALTLLASYPKSGNTWFRALLTNYFSRTAEPVALTALGGPPLLALTSCCDEYLGLDPGLLSLSEQHGYRGLICQLAAREMADGAIIKVHDAYDPALFPADAVGRVIYLARDPRVVAPAYAFHLNTSVDDAVAHLNDARYAMFDAPDRPLGQFRQHLGTWTGHVRGWLDQRALPVHLVRYEDLERDTAGAFAAALAFAGHTPDMDRVRFAVEASDLNRLRKQEAETGFPEKNPDAPSFFGRRTKGDVGLTAAQETEITEQNGAVMHRLGYL